MKILLNNFLFFVAMVFGLDAPVIANHACLQIDLKKKEFRIEYENLVYIDHPIMNTNIADFIKKMETKDLVINPDAGMTLTSIKLDKGDDEWSLFINGTFDDLETTLVAVGMNMKEDKIIYPQLEEETIIKSNGKTTVDGIIWDKNTKKIKLSLDRKKDTSWNKSIEENQGKIRSLSEFK